MHDFDAGRAAVSLAFTLQQIAGALSTALAGWLVGRCGAPEVILPATAMFGVILPSNKLSPAPSGKCYLFYAALGLWVHGMGLVLYGYVISHWFDRLIGTGVSPPV
ncbi:MAG TPA: hypothetical protein VHZ55_01930 [Bryobacteraceae bacterium]|nr:hypothetical protein [Bryobacteraceae bacterium]